MIRERVTRRYVSALFEAAQQKGETASVAAALKEFQQLYNEYLPLRNVLANPRLPQEKKRAILHKLAGPQAPPLLLAFLDLLLEKRRWAVLEQAGSIFARLQDEAARIRRVRVVSARPLSEKKQQQLREALTELFGGTIILEPHVDPNVLGGLAIKVGDTLWDGTLRSRLEGVREHLLHAAAARTF